MYRQLMYVVLAVVLLPACAPPKPDPNLERFPAFTVIDQGSHSGLTLAKYLVITNRNDWQELWRIHSNKPVPAVDFSTEMILAVFTGERPTGGYRVNVHTLEKTNKQLVVKLRFQSPSPNDILTMVLTQPYVIIKTAKQSLPVDFEM